MTAALPAYDLGPGREGDELLLNLIVYGMGIGLLLTVLWVLLPFAQAVRERRRSR
jgi:hypothetical protein